MRIRLFDPANHPLFDDLPWATPLEDWDHRRLVDMPVGLHRHVVRFVNYDGQFYALKELPQRLAEREYRLLRTLNDRDLPVVAVVALVDQRGEPDAVLITRYLNYALPFRLLFTERSGANVPDMLIESIATLLARLHAAGFYWGDCSLSNALFRRDELHLSGYALDTETSELHDRMTSGQRRADVELAVINVAGGLADLAAAGQLPDAVDPFEVAPRLSEVYAEIWEELHGTSAYDPQQPVAVERRLDRLHGLGFGVSEAVITHDAEPGSLSFRPTAIAGGFYRRELLGLTGIMAREHQAHRLLDDIREFGSGLDHDVSLSDVSLSDVSLDDIGHQWLVEVYDPVLAAIPREVVGKMERPQLFIEILDRHALEQRTDDDRDRGAALVVTARRYAADVLTRHPHERTPTAWVED